MRYWQMFWTINLLVGGCAFAFITGVVIIKGGRDLRNMFSQLSRREDETAPSVSAKVKPEDGSKRSP